MIEPTTGGGEEFRIANLGDADALVELVNSAYRPAGGLQGWTHEAELVSGQRINNAQMIDLIGQPDSFVLVLEACDGLIACVHIKKDGDSCHIGMLAVQPAIQGQGAGKRLLDHAESMAVCKFGSRQFVLDVISKREGLLNFYLRRGYFRTHMVYPYPVEAGVGEPRCHGLNVEVLAKCAAAKLPGQSDAIKGGHADPLLKVSSSTTTAE